MRTVLLASLRGHTRRYVAALLAVVIGVAFIIVTAALSSAVRNGLLTDLQVPYEGADVVVDKPDADDAAALLAAASEHDADAWLVAWTLQPVLHDGAVVDDSADIGQVPGPVDRRWQELEAGRFPDASGEALADPDAARGAGIELGDRVRIGSGPDAVDVEVVGMADSPSPFSSAALYLLWEDLERWQESLHVSSLAWAGPGDEDAEAEVVADLVPGTDPLGVDAFVQRVQKEVNNEVDLVAIIVLLFASIALLVSVLVINNTFAILFAQRLREFALLRCVGATQRQLLRSVRLESLVLGCVAAVVGVLAGVPAGHGLVALVRSQWPDALLGEAEIGAGWLVVACAVGIGVTLLAAWLPTRRVVRVSPLAALRPDDTTSVRTATGRLRVALGVLAVAAGVALLGLAVVTQVLPVLLAGGCLTFTGVLVLGPVIVPALIRALGGVAGGVLGPAGRLAAGNAARNPRRAAATAASLLIGVTLTTAVLTGMASSRSALEAEMDEQHPIDMTLTGTAGSLPSDLLDRVAAQRSSRPGRRRRRRRRGGRCPRHHRADRGSGRVPGAGRAGEGYAGRGPVPGRTGADAGREHDRGAVGPPRRRGRGRAAGQRGGRRQPRPAPGRGRSRLGCGRAGRAGRARADSSERGGPSRVGPRRGRRRPRRARGIAGGTRPAGRRRARQRPRPSRPCVLPARRDDRGRRRTARDRRRDRARRHRQHARSLGPRARP
ncbi:ABC transporter permease [Nocardioides bizhenqiangii]|uniref:ABC transporter permease n=1 Tax=Nocardioides bizhenqiangii TaxID=3095076 RepID=A0ABZ0ZRA8_9ACTN|nr:ABC transporter permease [Nocardioides sp. HM61]WQQ26874.1 ABC transporter permease [Nocardioides sp. HM61]